MIEHRLLLLARAWFDDATVAQVFEPLLADWQRECEAKVGLSRARCRVHGAVAFAMSFALTFAVEFRKPLPIGLPAAAWWTMELFVGATIIALVMPYGSMSRLDLLMPSMLALALPIAMTPATIILLSRTKWPTRELRKAVIRTALVTMLAQVVLLGWGTPLANERWRDEARAAHGRGAAMRGVRELTLPELLIAAAPTRLLPTENAKRPGELRQRIRLMLLPIPFVTLGFAVARLRRAPIAWACFWWVAAPATVMLPGWWRGPAMLLTIAAGLQWFASRRGEFGRHETI